jgi:hypothetical protein
VVFERGQDRARRLLVGYDDNDDRITEWTIAAAAADPQFGPILRAMSAEQLATSNADGRARMARAVHGA